MASTKFCHNLMYKHNEWWFGLLWKMFFMHLRINANPDQTIWGTPYKDRARRHTDKKVSIGFDKCCRFYVTDVTLFVCRPEYVLGCIHVCAGNMTREYRVLIFEEHNKSVFRILIDVKHRQNCRLNRFHIYPIITWKRLPHYWPVMSGILTWSLCGFFFGASLAKLVKNIQFANNLGGYDAPCDVTTTKTRILFLLRTDRCFTCVAMSLFHLLFLGSEVDRNSILQ